MARTSIPDPLARRHLLERALSSSQATSIAEAYLEADRPCDALAFLVQAEATSKLAELREHAVAQGDAFLLRAVSQADGMEVPSQVWERLAEAAESKGKALYAEAARRHCGDGDS